MFNIPTIVGPPLILGGVKEVKHGQELSKGQRIKLPEIREMRVCIGWEGGSADSEAFMLGKNGKVHSDEWFVFYGQSSCKDGSVQHTGRGDGNCETFDISLYRMSTEVEKIVFVLTVDSNFSKLRNAYIQLVDTATNAELFYFRMTEYYQEVMSMMVGEIYKKNGEWRFCSVGMGTTDDLQGLCDRYGVETE